MRKSVVFLAPLFFCSFAFGQLDSNSITVSASNNATLQPDQALFSVSVVSGASTGLDDVLAALQPAGITIANFSGVSTQVGLCPTLLTCTSVQAPVQWVFSLPAPLANTKATVASLTTLQQNIVKANNGFTLSFSIVGTQVSQQLAQSQTCSISSLLTSATTQAQALAAAGGLNLGAILAMSSSTSNVVSSSQGFASFGSFVSGIVTSNPAPCAITVKFNVTRN
jgi:uncharacterized protein YggE